MKLWKRTHRLFIRQVRGVEATETSTINTALATEQLIKTQLAIDLSKLDIEFRAKKTVNPMQPNTLDMSVYNMTAEHRKYLEHGNCRVILEAGYNDDNTQIFNGQARAAWSERDGQGNWVTHIETGDGFMEMAMAQINTSMGPGTTFGQMLSEVAQSMGIKNGNLNRALAKFGDKMAGMVMGKRAVVAGNSAKIMTDVCDSAGLDWTVQDGELQIMEKGKPIEGTGVDLTPETGMIGSPSLELKSAGSFSNPVQVAKTVALSRPGHLITVKSLINPGLRVGGKMHVKSEEIDANYKILQLEYTGNTRGQEWYVTVTGVHYT